MYARVVLNRCHGRKIDEPDPSTVDRCVQVAFAGDWIDFYDSAKDYLSGGCGVAG